MTLNEFRKLLAIAVDEHGLGAVTQVFEESQESEKLRFVMSLELMHECIVRLDAIASPRVKWSEDSNQMATEALVFVTQQATALLEAFLKHYRYETASEFLEYTRSWLQENPVQ